MTVAEYVTKIRQMMSENLFIRLLVWWAIPIAIYYLLDFLCTPIGASSGMAFLLGVLIIVELVITVVVILLYSIKKFKES